MSQSPSSKEKFIQTKNNVESKFNVWFKNSNGIFKIIIIATKRFYDEYGNEAAASISYYTIFSLFPMLLFLVSIMGFIIGDKETVLQISETITQAIPVSTSFINSILVEIIGSRSVNGVIGLLGLLFAGSGAFYSLSRNIDRAWSITHKRRNLFEHRLFAIGMIVILMFVIILWMTLITIIGLLPEVLIPIGNGISLDHSNLYKWINATVPWVLSFLTFWGLYKFIPNTHVKWHYALWGAVFSSIIWNIATNIFSWVISSGIANYEKLYGSLGAVIAFLTWIYITATITLIGAHLSAAIAFVKDVTTLTEDAKKELL